VTVPRATHCSRRLALGRLSLAAPSARGHPDPAAGVSARRAPSRARTCAHRRARRPRARAPGPFVPDVVGAADPPASAAPLVLRRPRHLRRRRPVVLHPAKPKSMSDVFRTVGVHARHTGANVEINGSENPYYVRFDAQLRTDGLKFTHISDAGLASQMRDTLNAFLHASSLLRSSAYR